jgi:nucleotidyltransferase substrate binding protein (TIGR01987 family)
MEKLDYRSLRDALGQLETSLDYCASPMAARDEGLARQFQAAAIQAFEFTYELAHKMLRRHLAAQSANPGDVMGYSFAELIKAGHAMGLIKGTSQTWGDYRHARSLTSHTYSLRSAEKVSALIPQFADEARHLLTALEKASRE